LLLLACLLLVVAAAAAVVVEHSKQLTKRKQAGNVQFFVDGSEEEETCAYAQLFIHSSPSERKLSRQLHIRNLSASTGSRQHHNEVKHPFLVIIIIAVFFGCVECFISDLFEATEIERRNEKFFNLLFVNYVLMNGI